MFDPLSKPFVAAEAPLFDGVELSHIVSDIDEPFEIDIAEQPNGTLSIRVREDLHSYVIQGVQSLDLASSIARSTPRPTIDNTHTRLEFITEVDGDFVIRIVSGERVGQQVGPGKPFMTVDGRPNILSYHYLSRYGSAGSETPIQAFDLEFVAMAFDERYHCPQLTGQMANIVTSLWLQDRSDYLRARSVDFHFVRRRHVDGNAISSDMRELLYRLNGSDTATVLRTRPDLFPVNGPLDGPLSKVDLSPSCLENYRYVTEPDCEKRNALRRFLLTNAITAADDLPPAHSPDMADPLNFSQFRKSRRDWSKVSRSPFGDHLGLDDSVSSYCSVANHDGPCLLVFHEYIDDSGDGCSTRYHVIDESRSITTTSLDLAEAILFLRAQEAGDPRVVAFDYDLSFEALLLSGNHIGHGFSVFSFPGLNEAWISIEQHEDGFSGPFDAPERHPTILEAVTRTYELFRAAIAPANPVNRI